MNKKLKALIVILCTLPIIILMGCSAAQDLFTPCFIEPEIIKVVQEHQPDLKPTSLMPFTTLWDAERFERIFDYIHIENQIAFERLVQDENLRYDFMKDSHNRHKASAKEIQGIVFSPTGPLGFLTVAGLAGTGGALLIKRPGDKSKKQIEQEVKTS